MIELRKALMSESEEILDFYRNIIFSIKDSEFNPKCNDRYPDLEFIENSISKGQLGLETFHLYEKKLGNE